MEILCLAGHVQRSKLHLVPFRVTLKGSYCREMARPLKGAAKICSGTVYIATRPFQDTGRERFMLWKRKNSCTLVTYAGNWQNLVSSSLFYLAVGQNHWIPFWALGDYGILTHGHLSFSWKRHPRPHKEQRAEAPRTGRFCA